MGACTQLCSQSRKYDPTTQSGDLDVSGSMIHSNDPLIRFEKRFPFGKMHIISFLLRVNKFGK